MNYFTYSYDSEESGSQYELELELKSAGFFVDLHPFKQAFRITGGFLINGNEVTGNAKLASGEKFDLDGTEYSLAGDAASMALTYDTLPPMPVLVGILHLGIMTTGDSPSTLEWFLCRRT